MADMTLLSPPASPATAAVHRCASSWTAGSAGSVPRSAVGGGLGGQAAELPQPLGEPVLAELLVAFPEPGELFWCEVLGLHHGLHGLDELVDRRLPRGAQRL